MRLFLAAAAAAVLMTGIAGAQYKMPQAPPKQPGAVQMAPNKAVQISTPSADDELNKARRISRDEAIKLVKQKRAVYVDVRSKETYDDGHLPGAISIPLSQMPNRLRDLPLKKFLITYCAWEHEHTSARAVLDLNAHGIKNAAALLGGWNAWKEAGLPIEATKVKTTKK